MDDVIGLEGPMGPGGDVSPEHATVLAGSGAVLLDVREIDEWEAGHAPGAHHVPLGQLRADIIAAGTEVVAVCRSGARSALAASFLRSKGLVAHNLAGGMQAWAASGFPVLRDDGLAGHVA